MGQRGDDKRAVKGVVSKSEIVIFPVGHPRMVGGVVTRKRFVLDESGDGNHRWEIEIEVEPEFCGNARTVVVRVTPEVFDLIKKGAAIVVPSDSCEL